MPAAAVACTLVEEQGMADVGKKSPQPDAGTGVDGRGAPGEQAHEPRLASESSTERDVLLHLKIESIEATGRGVIITDRQGKIIWANRAMRQLTGYLPEEIVGETPRIFQSGGQPISFYKNLWETILSGEEWQGELVNRRKDGSLYVEQMAVTPVRDAKGEIAHFIGIKHDVTSERRTQERTRLLALAVENSAELIASSDMEGRMTYVNPALLRALGRKEEEVLGKHFSAMLSRNNPASLIEQIGKQSYEPGGWHGECLMAGADGKDFPAQVTTGIIKDDHGESVGTLGIGRDISEKKRDENRLRESEELFRQLAENIREVFFVTTPEPVRVIYVSPAYEEMTGQPQEELYRRATAWMDGIPPEDRDTVIPVFQKAQRGEKTDMEYRIVRPDGSERWIRARTYPVYGEGNRLTRVVGFAEDITERKKAEADLRDAHERLNLALEDSQQRARTSEKLTDLVDLVQCCHTDEQAYKIAEEALGSIFAPCEGALCLTSASRDIVEAVAVWGHDLKTDQAFGPGDCWALRRGKTHAVKDASSPMHCPHVSASLKGGHLCVPLMAQGETLGLLYLQCDGPEGKAEGKLDDASMARLLRRAELVAERVSLALANLKLRQILRHQSVRDPLTGLFNRRYMEETLDRELARAARRNETVALAMCDLDWFKEFNDTFGHEAGDLVLRQVASLFRQKVRQGDIACRFGGEEFVLILPEATAAMAAERAESIRKEVEGLALTYRGHTLGRITVSTGVAMFPEDGATAEDLLRAADQSLYRAKAQGRDRVVFWSPS
jgi:diguanylate cyclase (GGDEF)-like protein/PAS domain S-box-containing protein